MPPTQRRYSYDRLHVLAGRPSILAMERNSGIHRRQWQRWKVGGIPETSADRAAAKMGFHPREVWPEWADVSEEAS